MTIKHGRRLTRAEAAALYRVLAAERPNPHTELEYENPYTLLVAVVLSARATDRGVNRATAPLFAKVKTPAQMLKLGEAGLGGYIKTIGLWRNKAKNVIALSAILVDKHAGQVPSDRAALEDLPGVGHKTANVVLTECFGATAIAVDTHVFRVANRTGLSRGETPLAVEADLERITPEAYKRGAHHWLILHGRYVCVARAPKCPSCAIAHICTYPDKTRLPSSTAAKARTKAAAPSGARSRKR
jgi:endonuclease-3